MFVAGVSVVLMAGMSGCSSSIDVDERAHETTESPSIKLDPDGQLRHVQLDYEHGVGTLPSDKWDVSAQRYVMKVLHAIAVRTDACMVKNGQKSIADEQDWSLPVEDEDRTLGRWSVDYASRYGVEPAPESDPAEVDLVSRGVEFNAEYSKCNEKAKTDLKSEIDFSQKQNIIQAIKWRAFSLAKDSTTGKRAISTWHECANGAGVVLDAESGAPSSQYSSQGKESETKALVAYAKCAVSTGAIQKIFDLRAAHENALIDAKEAQVASFAADKKKVEKELDRVIAGR